MELHRTYVSHIGLQDYLVPGYKVLPKTHLSLIDLKLIPCLDMKYYR